MAAEACLEGWKIAISRDTGALYLAIVEAIAHSIRKGELQEGRSFPHSV